MKRTLVIGLFLLLGISMLAGCGGDGGGNSGSGNGGGSSDNSGSSAGGSSDNSGSSAGGSSDNSGSSAGGSGNSGNSPAGTTQPDSPPPDETPPGVNGETHSAQNISALVPEGWMAFPFYSGGEESPNTFSIHKGALSTMDQWYTPGVQIQLFPDGSQFGSNTQKDMYEDVADLDPLRLGDYTWEGFTGLARSNSGEYDRPFALMWTDAGSDKIQVTVWLEAEDVTISLGDADVQAIIASIKPN